MKSNWETIKAEDFCFTVTDGTHDSPKAKEDGHYLITSKHLAPYNIDFSSAKRISDKDYQQVIKRSPVEQWDILFSMIGTIGITYLEKNTDIDYACKNMGIFKFNGDKDKAYWLYYYLQTPQAKEYILGHLRGTTQQYLPLGSLRDFPIQVPSTKIRNNITSILRSLDDRIAVNIAINENLEQQAQAIFKSWFGADIENLNPSNCKSLEELVTSVDNRGKTPPLSNEKTEYPIIDVRALSGSGRIINFSNCTKYVEEETYNNWFRNGHPKDYDILISTVGSLAEMKIYLGNIGCIAQNVVGFRSKGLSPIYLYQYLNYIRKELVSYNIGSVQPSIKVTHIIKHPIFIPENDKIEKFDMLIKDYTLKIYNNCCENKRLAELRDTLLPKLMNGEIDVSEVKI